MNNVVENGRFGEFGGQYAPETLMFDLNELKAEKNSFV